MTTYTATISHHSIASARVISITGSLTQAKRQASREFGAEFRDHRIVIRDQAGWPVASRLVADTRWQACA